MLNISFNDQNCNASIELATEDYSLFNDILKLLMDRIQTEKAMQKNSFDWKKDLEVLKSMMPPLQIYDVSLGC